MVWDLFVVILVLYLIKKWRKFSGQSGTNYDSKDTELQKRVKKFRLFPIRIPVVDELYILYMSRKYGVAGMSNLIHKLAPGENDICEIPVGPTRVLVFKDINANLKILNSPEPGHWARPNAIIDKMFDESLRNGVPGSPVGVWIQQRKVTSRAFSFNHFKFYVESMNKNCKMLASELSTRVQNNGGSITGEELHKCLHVNLIKIIFDFMVGSEGCVMEEALQYSDHFAELRALMVYRVFHPECHDYSPIWWIHPKRKRAQVLRRHMRAFVEKVIKHHEIKKSEHNGNDEDYETRCLIEEMIKHNASADEIYSEVATFLSAGHDTLVISTDFLLHHLACHPEYQKRCRKEVDALMGPLNTSCEDSFNFTIDDFSKLEYLERVILESSRMAPAFPATARELKVPLDIDDTLTLKAGTVVAISPWAVHYDPKYYPNPEVFDPDRFLPEEVERRGQGAYLAWSSGPRNCPGRRFSVFEMKAFAAWILRNFEVCTEDGLHDVKVMYEVTIKPERRFKTVLKMREEFLD